MKNTDIIFIIDASGSMAPLVSDTIGGFNGFLASQQALEGKATLTTVLFNSSWRILHDRVDIHEVSPMTNSQYSVGGMTAMLDAIGEIINRVQDRHDDLGAEKPEEVLFVITTDGEENSSKKFTKATIEKIIKHQTNSHGWKFMFLGANMDAVKEAESIGIKKDCSVNYDYSGIGTRAVFDTISTVTCSARTNMLSGMADLSTVYAAVIDDVSAKSYTDNDSAITTLT